MSRERRKIDRFFLLTVTLLTISGFVIFLSASLGLLAQNNSTFFTIAIKQTISLGLGLIAFFILSKIKYIWVKRASLFILIGAICVNLLLFVPQLAVYHGGASRWLDLGFTTFQPSELLKIGFIIYLAAWIHFAKDKIKTFRYGLLPYILIMAILGGLVLVQSDTDTLVIIAVTGISMLFIAGLPWKHLILAILIILGVVGGVLYTRPYALQRVLTFMNGGADTRGSGYQINQSLIAVGSGQMFGRGFGQSIQKFGYLPQPTDDSIFAVAAEEFGFVGSTALILLYLLFGTSIFRVGTRSEDLFGSFVAIGVGVLVIVESFLNIGAMLGILPLFGVPLLFISHGGTALIIALAATGIVANISKYHK